MTGVLADTWTWRVQHRVTPSWAWWVGHWARRDELPPRVDLAAVAARWAARVGRDRVHLVLGDDKIDVALSIRDGSLSTTVLQLWQVSIVTR